MEEARRSGRSGPPVYKILVDTQNEVMGETTELVKKLGKAEKDVLD